MRAASSNTAALEALKLLAPADVHLQIYTGLSLLPPFNPDLDGASPPASVITLRRAVADADALIVSCPEYARGIAGAFKNLLDWLVGSIDFAGKPVAILGTSQRAEHGPEQLRVVLKTMAADIVESASPTLPLLGATLTAAEIAAHPQLAPRLHNMFAALKAEVMANA